MDSSDDSDDEILEPITPVGAEVATTTPSKSSAVIGKPPSKAWETCFGIKADDLRALKGEKHSVCSHCNVVVKHNGHSLQVKRHLVKCTAYVGSIAPEELPSFLKEEKKRKLPASTLDAPTDKDGVESTGRVSHVWCEFTEDLDPWKLPAATCKWCKRIVKIQRKSERAKAHMLKCDAYQEHWLAMQGNPLTALAELECSTREHSEKKRKSSGGTRLDLSTGSSRKPIDGFEKDMAMFFYESGITLNHSQSSALSSAVKGLREDARVPSISRLSGELLVTCHSEVKKMVDKAISAPNVLTCVSAQQCVAVPVASGACVMRFYCVVEGRELLMDTSAWITAAAAASSSSSSCSNCNTDAPSENAPQEIYERLLMCPAAACSSTSSHVGMITDISATNIALWATLKDKYPTQFFYGCAMHTLDLITEKIFCSSPGSGSGKSTDAPLSAVSALLCNCMDALEALHENSWDKFVALNVRHDLAPPVWTSLQGTRWSHVGAVLAIMSSCEETGIWTEILNDSTFYQPSQSFAGRNRIAKLREVVEQTNFKKLLHKGRTLWQPLSDLYNSLQHSNLPLSEVYQQFSALAAAYETVEGLTQQERRHVQMACVTQHWETLRAPCHQMTYLLDPRYAGENMPVQEKYSSEEKICMYPASDSAATSTDSIRYADMDNQLNNFRAYVMANKKDKHIKYTQLTREHDRIHPKVWWLNNGDEWPLLKQLAVRLFSLLSTCVQLPPTESLPELDFVKAQKLEFIRINRQHLQEQGDELEENMLPVPVPLPLACDV